MWVDLIEQMKLCLVEPMWLDQNDFPRLNGPKSAYKGGIRLWTLKPWNSTDPLRRLSIVQRTQWISGSISRKFVLFQQRGQMIHWPCYRMYKFCTQLQQLTICINRSKGSYKLFMWTYFLGKPVFCVVWHPSLVWLWKIGSSPRFLLWRHGVVGAGKKT